ncbi:unnamed protein product [Closterium sp. NIES-53]
MSRLPPAPALSGASRGHSIRAGTYEDVSQHMPGNYAAVPPIASANRRPFGTDSADASRAPGERCGPMAGGGGFNSSADSAPLKPLASVKLRQGTNEDASQLMPENYRVGSAMSGEFNAHVAVENAERSLRAQPKFGGSAVRLDQPPISPTADRALTRYASAGAASLGAMGAAAATATVSLYPNFGTDSRGAAGTGATRGGVCQRAEPEPPQLQARGAYETSQKIFATRGSRIPSAGTGSEIASELESGFSFMTLTSDAGDSAQTPWMSPAVNSGGAPGNDFLRRECADAGEWESRNSWETINSNRTGCADTWDWGRGKEGGVGDGEVRWGEGGKGVGEGRGQCRMFSLEQIVRATNNFSNAKLLGRGAFGQVYKGRLLGCNMAIKRLEGGGWQGPSEYSMEVDVLSRMRHPHIVLLMGHCPDPNAMCILYEYLPGGSLQEYLAASARSGSGAGGVGVGDGSRRSAVFPGSGSDMTSCSVASSVAGSVAGGTVSQVLRQPLAWYDRVRILSEVSGALLYLHQHSPPIAHRDLKPDNVLLDGNRMSKVGDVGLARLIAEDDYNVTARVQGTVGYIDPEEVATCEISVLSDVYAFGLIVLQLLMGEPQVKLIHRLLTDTAAMVDAEKRRAGRVGGVCSEPWSAAVDAVLTRLDKSGGEWRADVARQLAVIGVRCADRARARRPDLEKDVQPVLMRLEEELRREGDKGRTDVDNQLLCPISQKRMTDPVVAADGFTYERYVIEQWLERNDRSPITGAPFSHRFLTPNNTLRMLLPLQ